MKPEYRRQQPFGSNWEPPKTTPPVAPLPAPKKASTIPEIVEELKREIIKWGGEIFTEKEYMTGGKVKEITLTAKFRVP